MSDQTDAVWVGVDKLTKPTRQRLERAEDGWVTEHPDDITDPSNGVCRVPLYRTYAHAKAAATARYATVPSLWDQATAALQGGETQPGRGSKPLRERSIADLDLMEIRSLIRDTAVDHLEQWSGRRMTEDDQRAFSNTDLRHFASEAVNRVGQRCTQCRCIHELDFWAYRFAQWARLLETYLHAVERQQRPIRLRNSRCPDCGAGQVTLNPDGEVATEPDPDNTVVPALVIDFHDGHVRAAQCSMCGASWFRGADMERLANQLGVGVLPATVNTKTA